MTAAPEPIPPKKPPLVVPSTSRKEIIIAVLVALAVLGAVIYGMGKMGNRITANKLTGVIEGKEFDPAPERQITIGKKGISTEEIKGDFYLKVRARGDLYWVGVDEATYNARKEGDSYTFPAPQRDLKGGKK